MSAITRCMRGATLLAVLASSAAVPVFAAEPHPVPDPGLHHPSRSQLSSAAYQMFRDALKRGMPMSAETMRRFGLDAPDDAQLGGEAPTDASRVAPLGDERSMVVALGVDAQANDRTGDLTCAAGCSNRPLGQAETMIAADGNTLLTSWNDTKGFCPPNGPVQGWAVSTNGGTSWTDLGDPPSPIAGGRYRGDPMVAVRRSTNEFYLAGLYEDPANGANSGLALMRVTFAGAVPTILNNTRILAGGNDFIDKPWIAVDESSGEIYITYTRFVGYPAAFIGTVIELIRSIDGGLTWSAPLQVSEGPLFTDVQGSRPAVVGPGLVEIVWREYGWPQSPIKIRSFNDAGTVFGPIQVVTMAYMNNYNGGPGFRRGTGIDLPSIAVDQSGGPNNGRIYVSWTEGVNYSDAPFVFAPQAEVEGNDTFPAANVFPVGSTLQGNFASAADVDIYKFSGVAGQTVFFYTGANSNTNFNIAMRIICANGSLANFASYRIQAFCLGPWAGVVFTLPTTGDYYLHLSTGGALAYDIYTAFDTPSAGERGRDYRDQFVSCSYDGLAWSTPVRVNDDPALYCGEFPEVTVDGAGRVHVFWHDWRDDAACGAESYEYMASSCDACVTWGANRRVSDERSFWSFNACGSANHGDYQGITSEGNTVYMCWADSRLGDPDVFTDNPRFSTSTTCPPNQVASPGSNVSLSFTLTNTGSVSSTFTWQLLDSNGWLTGAIPSAGGSVTLGPGGSQAIKGTFHVPADCVPPSTVITFRTYDTSIPDCPQVCTTDLLCDTATPTLASMVDLSAEPGLVRAEWQLDSPGLTAGRIERRAEGESWADLQAALADGSGRVRLEDRSVESGKRYGYRLSFPMSGGTVHSGESWIEVPQQVSFALQGARPNPASGMLTVMLSLPRSMPASLEVLDLNGRRLLRKDLGGFGAGQHLVRVDDAANLRPGLYMLRLTQGGNVATSRFSWVK